MNANGFSRRGFLKGLAGATGAAIGARLPGSSLIGNAFAATEPTSILLLHFVGGYNAIFSSAGQLQGSFGVNANNFTGLGNGISVDDTFANSMSTYVKEHMASVGVKHNISNHPGARASLWTDANSKNAGLTLANAIGGTASIKAACVGNNFLAEAPRGAVGGTSFQTITDLQKTIDALGGGAGGPRTPDRAISLAGVEGAQKMSENPIAGSPKSLATLDNGYKAAVDTLKQPVKEFNLETLRTEYQLGTNNTVQSFKSKLAAAELMIRSGTNVVSLFDQGWDSHGDNNGMEVRNKMTSYVLAPLNKFLTRMVEDTSRNVVVVMFGDFARSIPGSNHQPNLSATVIGKYVKKGSTGQVNANVSLKNPNTPSIPGFWSYLSAVTKATGAPFGANQHPTLLLP